jgi:hypothetical protein
MFAYKNGSYTVMILDDGTKIRYNKSNIYKPSRVESMDIKITNQCDMGCPMCHENSLPNGKHADVINNSIIDSIPPYTELAIGGGNPLAHPYLNYFLHKCKERKLIANITVNKKHFIDNFDFIFRFYNCNYINGIGISVFDITNEEIEMIKKVDGVCHVIIGVTPIRVMEKLANNNIKVLVLGYKDFRRGANYYCQNQDRINISMKIWSDFISSAIKEHYYSVISFDNLAIKQLNLKSVLTADEWDSFFMGDDGIDGNFSSASMYIDLVEGKFALNSCAPLDERYNCSDFGDDVNKMFNFLLKNS